jgi:hypothetical protein
VRSLAVEEALEQSGLRLRDFEGLQAALHLGDAQTGRGQLTSMALQLGDALLGLLCPLLELLHLRLQGRDARLTRCVVPLSLGQPAGLVFESGEALGYGCEIVEPALQLRDAVLNRGELGSLVIQACVLLDALVPVSAPSSLVIICF